MRRAICFLSLFWACSVESTERDRALAVFLDEMVARHGFTREELDEAFGSTRSVPQILELMNRAVEPRPWNEYRSRFVTTEKITGGDRFWSENAEALTLEARSFGVREGDKPSDYAAFSEAVRALIPPSSALFSWLVPTVMRILYAGVSDTQRFSGWNVAVPRKKRRISAFPVYVCPGPTVNVAFGAQRLMKRSMSCADVARCHVSPRSGSTGTAP